jgi:hypothetical protein
VWNGHLYLASIYFNLYHNFSLHLVICP